MFWHVEKEDVVQEARHVMEDSSTALALKWFESALDYNSAKAILDKGDAITETDVAPFLKTGSDVEM